MLDLTALSSEEEAQATASTAVLRPQTQLVGACGGHLSRALWLAPKEECLHRIISLPGQAVGCVK